MSSIPSKSKLDEYVKLGLIRSQIHPELPLSIYVYTETTAHERLWNSVTSICRGLVVDDKDRCVVRCIPKFFNEDEPHAMCSLDLNEKPVMFDKVDGSLIQVVNDKEYGLLVTSKGSFISDQAKWAQQIIKERYSPADFADGLTYVFELIHPENRIVIDYGDRRELVLLAILETETGTEFNIYAERFYMFNPVGTIVDLEAHMNGGLVEGAVIKTGSHRYKVKTGEYLRLHRIVTEFTPKRVWEALKDGDSLEFTNMPEEFQKWLDETIDELQGKFDKIFKEATAEFESTKELSNKDIGLHTDLKHKGIIFTLRNGKNPDEAIWKMVKPKKEII